VNFFNPEIDLLFLVELIQSMTQGNLKHLVPGEGSTERRLKTTWEPLCGIGIFIDIRNPNIISNIEINVSWQRNSSTKSNRKIYALQIAA
jgi:hypothetical protein